MASSRWTRLRQFPRGTDLPHVDAGNRRIKDYLNYQNGYLNHRIPVSNDEISRSDMKSGATSGISRISSVVELIAPLNKFVKAVCRCSAESLLESLVTAGLHSIPVLSKSLGTHCECTQTGVLEGHSLARRGKRGLPQIPISKAISGTENSLRGFGAAMSRGSLTFLRRTS